MFGIVINDFGRDSDCFEDYVDWLIGVVMTVMVAIVMMVIETIVMMVMAMMITVPSCGWSRAADCDCANNA
jgi:hypothetical protein